MKHTITRRAAIIGACAMGLTEKCLAKADIEKNLKLTEPEKVLTQEELRSAWIYYLYQKGAYASQQASFYHQKWLETMARSV